MTRIVTLPGVPDAPLVIVNPAAGRGRGLRAVAWLRERIHGREGARLEVTWGAGDARDLAAGAADGGHDRVVAVGGDGTVQEVVNGLIDAGRSASLGIVPFGSGNDLARSLGLPTNAEAAWLVAADSTAGAIDVARARNASGDERWFASAGGIGFDAQVATAMTARHGWQRGRAGYVLTTLLELRRFHNRRVVLHLDGESVERDVLFVAIANGAYYGGGMRIAPPAALDDGLLDVCIVGDISRRTALRQMPNLYRGTHVRHPAVELRTAARIEIDGARDTRVHLDGEPFGTLPLTIDTHRRFLEVARPDRIRAAGGSTATIAP